MKKKSLYKGSADFTVYDAIFKNKVILFLEKKNLIVAFIF